MSFEISFAPGKDQRGRTRVCGGTLFNLHPRSVFPPATQATRAIPPTESTSVAASGLFSPCTPSQTQSNDNEPHTQGVQVEATATATINTDNDKSPASASAPASSSTSDSAPGTVPNLHLIDYLASGSLYDFWIAQHPIYGKVVFQIVYVSQPPCLNPTYDEYVDPNDIHKHALKEEDNYMGPLKDLQGTIVPNFFGVYIAQEYPEEGDEDEDEYDYLAIVTEYVGQGLGPGYFEMSADWATMLYDTYKTIHMHGLMHNDVTAGHIIYDDSDDKKYLRIIGFRHADYGLLTDILHVALLVDEAAYVRYGLGLCDIRSVDKERDFPDYWQRLPLPDSEEFVAMLRLGKDIACGNIKPPYTGHPDFQHLLLRAQQEDP
ncbi:uncharacterized protein I303_102952 [Kwoniella dejecticola CBS 10117]|uniref:Protein kinase domain-containing protein n=1 Tax=Kwoniella dejecticola CBS 10117 TaxID=1296121 RepID=A0A1A6AA61_9TREE|nr:uncharacterized protein I303_02971 [Kwoniella dejecticola CBS 10117]OBR86949.1 hypothetical protein I303_02971 [Kwoniella dejecticola CBS 10117]